MEGVFERGLRVESGETAEEYRCGVIVEVDGQRAQVNWDGLDVVWEDLEVLRLEGSRPFPKTSLHTLPYVACPECKWDITPPVGTKIPALPTALLWQCPKCEQALVMGMTGTNEAPRILVSRIKLNPGVVLRKQKEVARG